VRNLVQIDGRRVVDPGGSSTALGCGACTGGVDEDTPHDLRRQREKMHSIVPVHVPGSCQTEIGLVNQGGALQRHA
jgi:hypothetical protein